MELSANKVTFQIGDLLKTSRPGHHTPEITFTAYAPDRRLCVITALIAYLERTLDSRGPVTKLFLTSRKPVHAASRDTLRRWTKQIMQSAGINMNIFAPHSTRSASTSKAAFSLPLTLISRTVGWSQVSTFAKYYNKPVSQATALGSAVLGGN